MRRALFIVFLLTSVSLNALLAKRPAKTGAAAQDLAAVAIVNQAVAATGGQSTSTPLSTVQLVGTATTPGDTSGITVTATMTYQATSAGFEFRRESQIGVRDTVFVSGYGSPAQSSNGYVQTFEASIGAAIGPTQVPLMVLSQSLSNANYQISLGTTQQIGSVNATHVQITNTANGENQTYTVEDWFFDPSTGLPVEVQCVVPDVNDPTNSVVGTEDFANWQIVSGLLVPLQITDSVGGTLVDSLTISSVTINPSLDPSMFQINTNNAKVRR